MMTARPQHHLLRLLILAMCALNGLPAAAEMPFSADRLMDGSFDGASSVISVDMDLDGDLDVAASARWDNSVAWWENPGWTKHTVATGFTEAYQICTGDFNSDGLPDLAGAARSAAGSNLRWWANPGPGVGGLWAEVNVSDAYLTQAFAVDAGDIDGDGFDDLVVAGYHSSVSGVFMWFRNSNGSGAGFNWFDIGRGYQTPHTVQLADVDDDQRLDVIGTTYAGDEVLWFRNDGTIISPDLWPVHSIRTNVDGAICARAADLDSDGDLDVVVAAHDAGDLLWFESSGASPPSWNQHTIESSFAGAYSVYPVDLDLDGDLDVVASARTDGAVRWWEHVGSSWYERSVDDSFAGARSAVAADLDQDGDPDIIAAADDADDVAWWENLNLHRDARYVSPSTVATTTSGYTAAATLDADRDGKLDIVATSSNSDGADDLTLFVQGAVSSLWTPTTIDNDLAGARSVRAADINSDGLEDLLVAAADAGAVNWYQGYGGTFFSEHTVTAGFAGAVDAAAADVDGDGDLDVVGVSESLGSVRWWQNGIGTMTAWTQHALASMAGAAALATGDLDGDGDPDVVAVSASSGSLRWFENLGSSASGWLWSPHTLTTALDAPRAVVVADLTGDGRSDIVAASSTGSPNLMFWRNLGGSPPTWSLATINGPTGSSDGIAALAAADFDLDGDLDLAGVMSGDQRVIQWRNGFGDGSLWAWHHVAYFSSITTPRAMGVGDVDHDGDPDPVVVGDTKATWVPNRGGQFAILALDESNGSVTEGENALLFTIIPLHLGRYYDLDLELEWLNLRFEDAAGEPLSAAQINALIERLYLFLDLNGNDEFEWGVDGLLEIMGTIATVSPGYVQFPVTHGQVNPSIGAGTSIEFYLVAEIAAGAGSATPSCFHISHSAGGTVTPLRYELYNMDPRPAFYSSVDSALICVDELVFSDDFETGGLTAWSGSTP